MDGLGLSGNGVLHGGNTRRVAVDPLQTRTLGNVLQRLQRQRIVGHLGHTGHGCCSNSRRCGNGSSHSNHGGSLAGDGCSSLNDWRYFRRISGNECRLLDGCIAALATVLARATLTAITVT